MTGSILVGSQLGKYEIRAEIGRGGMGTVYLGYDPLLDRDVAVKVLAPHLVWEKEFVGRFQREARAAAKLKHPNIVTIYDVGQEGGYYYFVMEYVPGQTLAARLRNREALPAKEVLAILRPLASALDYAHYQGIVHRDVKPGNVIVLESGQATLTDFGIARAMQVSRMTSTGTVVGTAEYMSPEQARALNVDARSDQYSLGIVAYQMLTAQVPFQADSTLALMYKVVHEPPPPLTRHRPDLPTGLGTVIERALTKEPGGRYPTVSASVAAMEQALTGAPVEAGVAAVSAEENPTMTLEALEAAGVPGPATPASARAAAPVPTSAPQPGKVSRTGVPVWIWALGGAAMVVLAVGITLALAGAGGPGTQSTPPAKETGIAAALPPEMGGETVTALPSSSHTTTLTPEPPSTPSATAVAPAAPVKETPAPSPSPSPASTPTATPEPTSTSAATATPLASPTPAATPTPKPSPTAERELAATIVSASPTVSPPTVTPLSVAATGELTLLEPAPPDESDSVPTTNGPTVFEWQYGGFVGSDQGFEVRVWREGEPQAGAHNAVEDNQSGEVVALDKNTYRLKIDITDVPGVQGRTGDYLWTVLLVQIDPEWIPLGIQASPGRLRFEAAGGGEGGGGGGGGGGGKPTF